MISPRSIMAQRLVERGFEDLDVLAFMLEAAAVADAVGAAYSATKKVSFSQKAPGLIVSSRTDRRG